MSLIDYYDVLGCTKESTQEEIKQAYRKKALKFHPDKNESLKTTEDFQVISEAWKVLGHPQSRKEYDVTYKQAELDTNNLLVYARLSTEELQSTDNEEILNYPCRCGSNYSIERKYLRKRNCSVHIPCQECTFILIVQT